LLTPRKKTIIFRIPNNLPTNTITIPPELPGIDFDENPEKIDGDADIAQQL
jgi:hypothetical protein